MHVTCVNGAGAGNTSDPVEAKTNAAREISVQMDIFLLFPHPLPGMNCVFSSPPPAPSRGDLADAVVEALEQPNDREFIVTFNKPSDINGPIRYMYVLNTLFVDPYSCTLIAKYLPDILLHIVLFCLFMQSLPCSSRDNSFD